MLDRLTWNVFLVSILDAILLLPPVLRGVGLSLRYSLLTTLVPLPAVRLFFDDGRCSDLFAGRYIVHVRLQQLKGKANKGFSSEHMLVYTHIELDYGQNVVLPQSGHVLAQRVHINPLVRNALIEESE